MPGPPPQLRRGRRLSRRSSGDWGEEIALRYLRRRGYELVERNYRTRHGELDLILRHGPAFVFCEVKSRTSAAFGAPQEAVTREKQARIRRLAARWLGEGAPVSAVAIRFDVASVLAGQVEVLEGAF